MKLTQKLILFRSPQEDAEAATKLYVDDLVGTGGSGHNHDDRYYTETESDARFVNEADFVLATDAHDDTANPGAYPVGESVMRIATAAGWPGTGTPRQVVTFKSADTDAWQLLRDAAVGGLYFRKATDATTWGAWSQVSVAGHNHDDRYFTETESDARFAAIVHNHDDRYYTETESDALLDDKADLVGGVIPTSQLPALAINDTYTVASEAAMVALTAQRGDMAIRTDFDPDRVYVLTTDDATQAANWTPISFGGAVVSVNGQDGTVVLNYEDVGAAAAVHNHDDRYYTETEVDTALAGKSNTNHNHDDRYYTETEVDTALAGKANTSHTHDDRYYTETEIDTKLTPEGWVGVTPAGAWTQVAAASPLACYKHLDRVYLRGRLEAGAVAEGSALFTLPSGYRPPYPEYQMVMTDGGPATIAIATTGAVTIGPSAIEPGNDWLSVDGLSFRV